MYKIEYNKLHASFLDSLLFVPIVHFATVRFASIPSINQYNKFKHHKDNHKNQQDTKKPFHINIIATLFAPSLPRKKSKSLTNSTTSPTNYKDASPKFSIGDYQSHPMKS
ncbi:hypothetical protein AB1K77_000605 [Citrobacter sedlakii]